MKRSRRIALGVVIAAAVALLALVVAGTWLLASESGARFAATRATAMLDGLDVGDVRGTIVGGVSVANVRYAIDAVEVEASDLRARLRLRTLLLGAPIRVAELAAGSATVRLRAGDSDATPADGAAPSLPQLTIERVALDRVRIEPAGGDAIEIDRLRAAVALSGATVAVEDLDLEGARGAVRGALTVDLARAIPVGATALEFRVRDDAERDWQGRLAVTPQRRGLAARLNLAAPLVATVELRHGQRRGFAATVEVPRQDGVGVGLDGEVEARIEVSGGAREHRVLGALEAFGERVELTGGTIVRQDDRAIVEALALDWRDRGRILVEGEVPLAEPASWGLALTSEGFALPRGDGGRLDVSGRIDVGGPRREPVVAPALAIRADDLPPGALSGALALRGGAVHADELTLALARGRVVLDGPIGAREPHVLSARARDLDPGLLLSDWPGRISGELRFEGARGEQGLSGELTLEGLAGELRGRPLSGAGALAIVDGRPGAGALALDLGRGRLRVGLDGPERIDASLSAPDLSELVPELGGNLELAWRRDRADRVDLRGEALRFGESRVAIVSAQAVVGGAPGGALESRIDASGLVVGETRIESLRLALDGSRARHAATLALRGPLALEARVDGGLIADGWRGRLSDLALDDAVRLESPAELSWDRETIALGESCLAGALGRTCVALRGSARSGEVSAGIERLDLAGLFRLLSVDAGIDVDGVVDGNARIGWRDGRLSGGELRLRSPGGRVEIPDRADVELGWGDLVLDVSLDGASGTIGGSTRLVPEGTLRLDGGFALDGPEGFRYDVDVEVAIRELDLIEAFTAQVADPEGDLSGQFKLRGGARGWPDVSGAVALTGFTAQIPEQAIRVRDGVLVVAGVPDRLIVRGSLRSGDGVVSVDGRIDANDPVPAELVISGENFRIANSPTLMLIASPDLRLALSQRRWNLDGRLAIPRARIDLERLEGGVSASPDVVVVDDPAPADPARPWLARVQVRLGDDVRLSGFGFDGRLAGQLDVRQRQGSQATATGQLDVFGTYRAYGQRLTIREGHLRYAASPLAEPTIDLRAERTVRGETVALAVTGNALAPTARVVGAPGMSEQDALAMLVTGRPLRATGSGDRDALSGAASALGIVGSDLLTSRLRGSLGLDEFGVTNDTALDGEAFTIGKYLSPRLYVGYGIGLLTRGEVFTARFLLTDRLDIEASSGQTQRAAINYRIER
jgi:translocation and assembly module TamB